jgi:dTDP-4-dehydrorhamnose reductase
MKILVTGAAGQVGWELLRSLQPLGNVVGIDRNDVDLADTVSLSQLIERMQPEVIVNAAAYTAVDRAEDEVDLARSVNHIAPKVIAEEAARLGALLVHYSTDYVFDGSKNEPYTELDPPCPCNVYGSTKLDGVQAVQSSSANAVTLRVSWVYSARGRNFLSSILRLAREREELRIVADQIGAPTSARVIADATAHVVRQSLSEIQRSDFVSDEYNLVCGGQASWFDFANAIVDEAQNYPSLGALAVREIMPISTSEYPTPARRPLNSRLSTAKLQSKFDLHLTDWREALGLCLQEFA